MAENQLIERARQNIRERRNPRGEESPQNQLKADLRFQQMRKVAEGILDLYGQTKTDKDAKWLRFHPWIVIAALISRVTPTEILETRELSLTLNDNDIEPPATVTLSHAGRTASRSWFINVLTQGISEELHLYKDGGKVFPLNGTNHPLRRANLQDAQDYQPVIDLFTKRFQPPVLQA